MKILVVEDEEKHLQDAIEAVRSAGHQLVAARTLSEALVSLDRDRSIETVISDIFFPHHVRKDHDEDRGGDYSNPDTPCGIAVALYCTKRKIPFVFCTSGWHHGNRYQWIFDLCEDLAWDFVENLDAFDVRPDDFESEDERYYDSEGFKEASRQRFTKEAETKNWKDAIACLERIIASR